MKHLNFLQLILKKCEAWNIKFIFCKFASTEYRPRYILKLLCRTPPHFKTQLQVLKAFCSLTLKNIGFILQPTINVYLRTQLSPYVYVRTKFRSHTPEERESVRRPRDPSSSFGPNPDHAPRPHPRAGEFSLASSLFSLLPRLLFSSVTLKPKPVPN